MKIYFQITKDGPSFKGQQRRNEHENNDMK